MLEHCCTLNGVLSAEDDREHRALGMDLVDRTEPTRQKLFLFGPIALEPGDVAAKRCDFGLGPLDPVVEPCHIALLLGQTTLGLLDLAAEGRVPPQGL